MYVQFSPRNILVSVSALLVLVTVYSIWLATSHPWLGLELEPIENDVVIVKIYENSPAEKAGLKPGQIIKQISISGLVSDKRINLDASDLIIEPDDHAWVKNYLYFFKKQSDIYSVIQSKRVTFISQNSEHILVPEVSRPVSTLTFYFWFQLFCAFSIVIMGALVWAYSQREVSSRLYALATIGLLVAIVPSAIYTTRELAFDGGFFHLLSMTNQLGVMLFAAPGTALFWFYPKPISRFPVLYLFAVFAVVFLSLNYLQVYESLDYAVRYPIVFWLALDVLFGVLQWQRSRADPVSRAQLKWFIIAWISGPIAFVSLNVFPLLLGFEPFITQKTGWVLFVFVYLGMALGLRRYRLFNLDKWILNAWFWVLCGAGVILFDIILFANIGLDHNESIVMSLALVGWVYFPLRQYVFERLAQKNMKYSGQHFLPELLNVLLIRSQSENPRMLWAELLEHIYAPLHIEVVDGRRCAKTKIEDDGQSVVVPCLPGEDSLRLYNANKGERLFSTDDREMIDAVFLLYKHVIDFQDAQRQGAIKERKRLARDLHDDVSSKVLSMIYRSDSEENAQLGRETLEELRNVINDLENAEQSLQVNLFDWQCEVRQRCEESGLKLVWKAEKVSRKIQLSTVEKSNLRRILREAISNIIKHSNASVVTIELSHNNDVLNLMIKDNGKGFDVSKVKKGNGLINIKRRAKEMDANFDMHSSEENGCVINVGVFLPIEHAGILK